MAHPEDAAHPCPSLVPSARHRTCPDDGQAAPPEECAKPQGQCAEPAPPVFQVCGHAIAILGAATSTCTSGGSDASPVSLCGNAVAVLGTAVSGCSGSEPEGQGGLVVCGNAVAVLGTASATCRKAPVARAERKQSAGVLQHVSWPAPPSAFVAPERPRLYGHHSGWTPARPSSAGSAPGAPDRAAWVISPIGGALPIPRTPGSPR
ncbi:hypothetical protein [Actinocorallia aurea]